MPTSPATCSPAVTSVSVSDGVGASPSVSRKVIATARTESSSTSVDPAAGELVPNSKPSGCLPVQNTRAPESTYAVALSITARRQDADTGLW